MFATISDRRNYSVIYYGGKLLIHYQYSINLGTANAIQTFTDMSLDDYILRITVISALLTDSGLPVVAIRKIPKNKYNLLTLSHKGMFDMGRKSEVKSKGSRTSRVFEKLNPEIGGIVNQMIHSKEILFTEKEGFEFWRLSQ